MSVNFDKVVRSVYVGAKDTSLSLVKQTDRVISLTYEDNESKADKLSLQIRNHDLAHLDSPLWRQGNIIRVGWGYGGFLSPLRTVTIDKVTGNEVLKVEASGDEVVHNKVQINDRVWFNLRRSQVVRELALEMGFTDDQMFIQNTEEVYPHIIVHSQTRTQLIKEMARREGFDFYIDFDGFHFHERDLAQKPQLTLRYRKGDPNNGLSDIIKFSFDKGVDAMKPGAIRVMGRDPLTKELVDFTADNTTVPRTSLGGSVIIAGPDDEAQEPLVSKTKSAVIVPTTELTAEGMRRYARGLFKRVQLNAIELKCTARGRPELLAKSNVKIEGFGPTLSGIYYVAQVKHTVGGSNYTMDLHLKRDALTMAVVPSEEPLPGQGDGVTTSGSVNDKEPSPDGELPTKSTSDGVEYADVGRSLSLPFETG